MSDRQRGALTPIIAMPEETKIRRSQASDVAAIESLYPDAFPDEDLVPLVRELLQATDVVLSLVAARNSRIVAHAAFTLCRIAANAADAALLGPIAVAPDSQSQGIGSALIRDGLHRLQNQEVKVVCVLGDPAYYGRLGFNAEPNVKTPYAIPDEWRDAWQTKYLNDGSTKFAGTLEVPAPWQQPELWSS